MILSVFCVRLIRMVGPSATAAAAAPVVVTNSRRPIPFRLVMDLPSIQNEMRCLVSGAWCLGIRLPDTRHQTPDTHQIVYITLRAYWSAVRIPVLHRVTARKYSSPSA